MRLLWLAGAALALTACGGTDDAEQAALVQNAVANADAIAANIAAEEADAAALKAAPDDQLPGSRDAWIGQWKGVEGMVLNITRGSERDQYKLAMAWSADDADIGEFIGHSTAGGIVFKREGKTLQLTAGTGEETGLKWLEGKKDCLIVEEGEGYCRD